MATAEDFATTDMNAVLEEEAANQERLRKFAPKVTGEHFIVILPPLLPEGKKKAKYYTAGFRHYDYRKLTKNPTAPYSIFCRGSVKDPSGDSDCFACQANEAITVMLPNGELDEVKNKLRMGTRKSARFFLNILEVNAAGSIGNQGEARIWEIPTKVQDQIRSLFKTWGDLSDPRKATVLKLHFEKKLSFTTCESVQPTPTKIALPIPGDWIDSRTDFVDMMEKQTLPNSAIREHFGIGRPRSTRPREDVAIEGDDTHDEVIAAPTSAPVSLADSDDVLAKLRDDPEVQAMLKDLAQKRAARA